MNNKNIKIKRKNRISVDIDSNNQFHLLKSFFNMKRLTDKIYVYKTNKGYHIQGLFKNRTTQQNIDIRRLLLDDKARIKLDENRIDAGLDYLIETLFVFGKVNKGVESIEEPYDVINTEQFWGFRYAKRI